MLLSINYNSTPSAVLTFLVINYELQQIWVIVVKSLIKMLFYLLCKFRSLSRHLQCGTVIKAREFAEILFLYVCSPMSWLHVVKFVTSDTSFWDFKVFFVLVKKWPCFCRYWSLLCWQQFDSFYFLQRVYFSSFLVNKWHLNCFKNNISTNLYARCNYM